MAKVDDGRIVSMGIGEEDKFGSGSRAAAGQAPLLLPNMMHIPTSLYRPWRAAKRSFAGSGRGCVHMLDWQVANSLGRVGHLFSTIMKYVGIGIEQS